MNAWPQNNLKQRFYREKSRKFSQLLSTSKWDCLAKSFHGRNFSQIWGHSSQHKKAIGAICLNLIKARQKKVCYRRVHFNREPLNELRGGESAGSEGPISRIERNAHARHQRKLDQKDETRARAKKRLTELVFAPVLCAAKVASGQKFRTHTRCKLRSTSLSISLSMAAGGIELAIGVKSSSRWQHLMRAMSKWHVLSAASRDAFFHSYTSRDSSADSSKNFNLNLAVWLTDC